MAAPVVTFSSVSTPDAVTGSAPFKVSRDTAKDDLTYTWAITFTGTLRFWQERIGGSLRTNGTRIRSLGVVCGLGIRCGHPDAKLLGATSSPQGRNRTFDIDAYLASDGDYRFGVDALNAAGEWSSTS